MTIQEMLEKSNTEMISLLEYYKTQEPGSISKQEQIAYQTAEFQKDLFERKTKDNEKMIVLGMPCIDDDGEEYVSAEMFLMDEFLQAMKNMPNIDPEDIPADEEIEKWDTKQLGQYVIDVGGILPNEVGYFFSSLEECLTAEVDEDNMARIGADEVIGSFLFEASFNAAVEGKSENIMKRIEDGATEAEKFLELPKEKQDEFFRQIEELSNELGIVDNKMEENEESSMMEMYISAAKTSAHWMKEFLLIAKNYK